MTVNRRTMLRRIMPAVALPLVAADAALPKHQVSAEELRLAFQFNDGQLLTAEDINLRFGLLIDMLFERDPDHLRKVMERLVDIRKQALHVVEGEVVKGEPEAK